MEQREAMRRVDSSEVRANERCGERREEEARGVSNARRGFERKGCVFDWTKLQNGRPQFCCLSAFCDSLVWVILKNADLVFVAVSYTHLTLPTKA